MATDDTLFRGLQMLQQGVQQAATSYAINDAQKLVSQINMNITDEAQKRQALSQLGNELALKLAGTGATGTQIQTAFNAIAPQQFGSAEQMQLEGELSGNKQLIETSERIIGKRNKERERLMQLEFGLKTAAQDRAFQRELAMESMKLQKKAPELKPGDVSFQTNINVANKFLDELEQAIDEKGTFELATPFSSAKSKKASAKLEAIPYQLAITYAKIVDPDSVAREGEVAAAQKYLVNLGLFSNEGKVKEQLQNMRDTINEYSKQRAAVKGGQSVAPAANDVMVKRLPNGQPIKVRKLADGSYEEVP